MKSSASEPDLKEDRFKNLREMVFFQIWRHENVKYLISP